MCFSPKSGIRQRGSAIIEVVAITPLILGLIISAVEFSGWYSFQQKLTLIGREASNLTVRRCLPHGTDLNEPKLAFCLQKPTFPPDPVVPAGQLWKSINTFAKDPFTMNQQFKTSVLITIWERTPVKTAPRLVTSLCIEPTQSGGKACAIGVVTKIPATDVKLQEAIFTEGVVVVSEVFSEYRALTGANFFDFPAILNSNSHYYAVIS